MFIDRLVVHVRGGDGGRGCISFRREKHVPRGGPDGGDGGKGGDVVVRSVGGLYALSDLSGKRQFYAEAGRPGSGANRQGRSGRTLYIDVPVGTIVRDRDQNVVLKDLTKPGESVVVARGGKGGRGNRYLMKRQPMRKMLKSRRSLRSTKFRRPCLIADEPAASQT
ncbi:MAG TPA: hypothetical protein EYP25_07595 [Anaerolineae bacterium]|nr:hypothetical protein [Anaerolineae bacterium]